MVAARVRHVRSRAADTSPSCDLRQGHVVTYPLPDVAKSSPRNSCSVRSLTDFMTRFVAMHHPGTR